MLVMEENKELREKAYEIIKRKGEFFSLKFQHSDLKTLLHELDDTLVITKKKVMVQWLFQ